MQKIVESRVGEFCREMLVWVMLRSVANSCYVHVARMHLSQTIQQSCVRLFLASSFRSLAFFSGMWVRGDGGEDLGEELANKSKQVNLTTFPHPVEETAQDGTRLKAPSSYSKRQILEAIVDVVEKTQGPRLAPLRLELMCLCLLYTSPSPRDKRQSRMPSSA